MAKSDLGNHDVDTSHPELLQADADQYFKDLLEASSLGTPAARQVREQTDGSIIENVRRRLMTHTGNQPPAARLLPSRRRYARPVPRVTYRRPGVHRDQLARLARGADEVEVPLEPSDSVDAELLDFPGIGSPVKEFAAIDFGTSASTVTLWRPEGHPELWRPGGHPDEAGYDQVNAGMTGDFGVGKSTWLNRMSAAVPLPQDPSQATFQETLKKLEVRLKELQDLLDEPFRVLVVGSSKAGKSTLLNSLFSSWPLQREFSGESLKDESKSPGSQDEPITISMLGATGSGKTTALLAGMYRDLAGARDFQECPVCRSSLPDFGACLNCGFPPSAINEPGVLADIRRRDDAPALVLRDLRNLRNLAAHRLEPIRLWHLFGEPVGDLPAGDPAGWDLAQWTFTTRIWSLPGSPAERWCLYLPDLPVTCQVSLAAGRWRIELAARQALRHGLSDARSPRLLVARYPRDHQVGAYGPDPAAVPGTGRPVPRLAERLPQDQRNPGILAVLRRFSRRRRTGRARRWFHLLQVGVPPYAQQTGPSPELASTGSMRPPSVALQRMQMLLAGDRVKPVTRAYNEGLRQPDLLDAYRAMYGKDPRTVNFLRSLEPAEYDSFAAVAVRRSFARGARLMAEGEPADHVIVIVSGWTRVTAESGGAERTLAERGPGQLVGERAALRGNVRSATVTALTDVTALVMPTEEFASFITAHPRVLDVVENQIYERLTEDQWHAFKDWRGGVPTRVASDSLAARQVQALAGESCTVILTDVVGFGAGHRNDRHRLIIRDAIWAMMEAALGSLWDASIVEDRGDGGMLIVAPPRVPAARIMEGIGRELPGQLRRHNSTYPEPCRFRLRVAVNAGPVTTDELGMAGEAIIHTARLVDAPALKAAMHKTGHGLGVIVSEFAYETAIRHAGQFIDEGYQGVAAGNEEFRGSARIRLYDLSLPSDLQPATAPCPGQ